MRAYNFSKLNTREKRFYSFSDITLSKTGIPTKFIAMLMILVVLSVLLNLMIGNIIGDNYVNPFHHGDIDTAAIMIVFGIPILIAYALFYIKISQYRLYQIAYLMLKPKQTISISGRKASHTKVSFNVFLER